MKKFLLKILDIEKEDSGPVLLLLAKTFFMGIFIATYDVGANTLFFAGDSGWSPEDLPLSYILSGVLGIFSASVFALLQRKMSFTKLSILNLIVITLIVSGTRYGFELNLIEKKYLLLITLVWLIPLNIMLFLGFWGLLGRMFNIRKAKHIEGILDSAQILATIIGFFGVPVLYTYVSFIGKNNENMLIVSAGSIFIVLLIEIFLVNKFGDKTLQKVKVNVVEGASSYSVLLKSKYFNLMALFMMASIIVFYFVDYSFYHVAVKMFKGNDTGLGNYLGFFGAATMIITILIQTFVYDRIVSMYGLKMGLIILPALLLMFTLLSSLIGGVFGDRADLAGKDTFFLFFLAISMSKLFSAALREAVEDPSFKMLFQPLDSTIKFDVQAKIEGVINQFALVTGGGILFSVGLFHFMEPRHFSYLLVFILGQRIQAYSSKNVV